MILVSACLVGINCKYNGANNFNQEVIDLVNKGGAVPVCPEQLGGCPTPRNCAEIVGGTAIDVLSGDSKVLRNNGQDGTSEFIKGARETLKIAKLLGINKAILKSKSPSCGFGKVYNGEFSGQLIDGNGITAQLLVDNGIKVIDENSLKNFNK